MRHWYQLVKGGSIFQRNYIPNDNKQFFCKCEEAKGDGNVSWQISQGRKYNDPADLSHEVVALTVV